MIRSAQYHAMHTAVGLTCFLSGGRQAVSIASLLIASLTYVSPASLPPPLAAGPLCCTMALRELFYDTSSKKGKGKPQPKAKVCLGPPTPFLRRCRLFQFPLPVVRCPIPVDNHALSQHQPQRVSVCPTPHRNPCRAGMGRATPIPASLTGQQAAAHACRPGLPCPHPQPGLTL